MTAGWLVNLYGSTETTGDVLCKVLDLQSPALPKATSEYVLVGTPVAGSRAYILDVLEERVPENSEGELYVSGPLVADGYLGGEADDNRSYRSCTKRVRERGTKMVC